MYIHCKIQLCLWMLLILVAILFLKSFLMWTIFKVFMNLLQYCFCLYILNFLIWEACGILAPLPGIKPTPRALEGEVLTTRSPGKSLVVFLLLPWGCEPVAKHNQCLTFKWPHKWIHSVKQSFVRIFSPAARIEVYGEKIHTTQPQGPLCFGKEIATHKSSFVS